MNANQLKKYLLLGFATYAFIAAVVCLTIYRHRPPAVVDASAPATEFSAMRAMEHLKVIAARPHPIGSPAQEIVRQQILSELGRIGLDVEVQKAVVAEKGGGGAVGATVQNIVAQLKGTQPGGKAILLTAHYDSVPNSPGASDDGSGVVVLLESLRALKAGAPLKNDLICLFNEGEEIGLMGAKAFVNENPLAKNVGLVLNFEARGTRGPVFMFETSDKNGWLIEEFAKAVPHPFASSLMYSIYKVLPNDTDLTVFKKAGISGYNFAYIGGVAQYHSQRDDLESIDLRSIQHGGSYALPLIRHLGNVNLDNTKAADAIYFDILGMTMIAYSTRWVLPISISLILLFAVVAVIGLKRNELTVKGMALGVLVTLLGIIVAILSASFILEVLFNVRPGFSPLRNASLFLISFAAIAIALSSALVLVLNKWISFNNLSFGALLLWLIITVVISFLLPGASYLFQWPLFFLLVAIGATFLFKDREQLSGKTLAIICLGVMPGLVLMTGSTYNVFQGLMLGMLPALMLLVMLSVIVLVPLLKYIAAPYKWNLPLVALLVGVGFLLLGMAMPVNDKGTPRRTSVQYSLNVDKKDAVWVSTNRSRDEWTSQFLTEAAQHKTLPDHFRGNDRKFLADQAPVLDLGTDNVEVLSDRTENGVRLLSLKLNSTRNPRLLGMHVEPNVRVLSAVVNGKRLDYRDDKPRLDEAGAAASWEIMYNAYPPEGIDLSLELKPADESKQAEPVTLTLLSVTDGLPEIANKPLKPRPDTLIPASNSDVTRVTRTFKLAAPGGF